MASQLFRTGLAPMSQPSGPTGTMLSSVDPNFSELLRKVFAAAQTAISRQNPGFGTAVADASYSNVGTAGTQVTFASSTANFYFYIHEGQVDLKGVAEEREIISLDDALKVFGGKQLEELDKLVFPPEKQATDGTKKELALGHFHLHGSPGLGKTQLAIKFANQHLHDFSLIWVIRSSSDDLYKEDYKRLATSLNIPISPEDSIDIIIERVHLKLQNPSFKKPWLIILDDVVKPIPLPPIRNGIIFSTSRQETLWRQKGVIPFSIRPFNLGETEELFTKSYSKDRLQNIKDLWTLFEGWPLLLIQAWNYLSDIPDSTLQDYLKELKATDPMEESDPSNPYPRSLNQAFEATLQRLINRSSETLKLVYMCAYLNPGLIPLTLLNRPETPSWRLKVIHPLEDFSILKLNKDGKTFHIHSLWQEFLQKKLQKEGKGLEFFLNGTQEIYRELQKYSFEQFESWEIGKTCAPHIDTMRKSKLWEQLEWKLRCFLLDRAGDWLFQVNGNANAALGFYSESLALKEKQLGESNRETILSFNNVGICLISVGEYPLAFDILSRAEQLSTTSLKENDSEIARTLNGLASYYNHVGQHQEALPYLQQCLKIRKDILGENHPDTIKTYINIGMFYWEVARLEKVKVEKGAMNFRHKTHRMGPKAFADFENLPWIEGESRQRILDVHLAVLGDRHLWTARSYEAAAERCRTPEKAVEYLQQSLKIKEALLDKFDPAIVETLRKIINILNYQLRLSSEADKYINRVKELDSKKNEKKSNDDPMSSAFKEPFWQPGSTELMSEMGLLHPLILKPMFTIYEFQQFAGVYLKKALELSQKSLGEKHPIIGTLRRIIGLVLIDLNQKKAAREYIQNSLEIMKERFGEKHQETMRCYLALSRCIKDESKDKEAKIQALRKAWEIAQTLFKEDHEESIQCEFLLGKALDRADREEGLIHIENVIQNLKKRYGYQDERLVGCYLMKIMNLYFSHKYADAFTAIKEVFSVVQEMSKKAVESVLSELLYFIGNIPEKTEEIKETILPIVIQKLGENHKKVRELKKALHLPVEDKKKDSSSDGSSDDSSEDTPLGQFEMKHNNLPHSAGDLSQGQGPTKGDLGKSQHPPTEDNKPSTNSSLDQYLHAFSVIKEDFLQAEDKSKKTIKAALVKLLGFIPHIPEKYSDIQNHILPLAIQKLGEDHRNVSALKEALNLPFESKTK